MNYGDTVSWMFKQLPMYQNIGKSVYKEDLSNTILLAEHLNNPQNDFKSIHVAGTNGKGSTSHMLSSILQEAGYNVGLYTSPHLKDFRERIKINGKMVTEGFVEGFVEQNKTFFEEHSLSFFEMTVGMAFEYFSQQQVDMAIIEVGMGGRLDSTNIIQPEVSVITNIGMDHTQYLGTTLEAIAKEKAGIIKENIPVIIGETQPETEAVFKEVAIQKNAEIYFADQLMDKTFESDLKGKYQAKNLKTVTQTIEILKELGYNVSDDQLKSGLKNVVENTGLLGRWQQISDEPRVICDTGHNKEGLSEVIRQLDEMPKEQLHMVFGVVNDKDLDSILSILPKDAIYYFCKPNIPRGLNEKKLKEVFDQYGFNGKSYSSVSKALKKAKKNAKENDLVFVGGSTFVVAEVI